MYRAPGPPVDWPALLKDRGAFQTRVDEKLIPSHLTQHLWEALTLPLHHTKLQQDLAAALQSPPVSTRISGGHPAPQGQHGAGGHGANIQHGEELARSSHL